MGRTENRLRSPVPVQRKISLNICSGIWHCMVERCESPVAVSNPVPATAQMQLTEPQQDELERCARSRSVAARAVQRGKIILGSLGVWSAIRKLTHYRGPVPLAIGRVDLIVWPSS